MIKTVENRRDIIPLWQEAFGDSEEDILYFTDNLRHGSCIGYYDNGRLVSMLYLVECNYKYYMSEYVYAACTLREYRGRGIMSSLLDYCKKRCENGFCLIPANAELIEYYKKRGLDKEISVDDISFNEDEGIIEYLFEGCELNEPIALMF